MVTQLLGSNGQGIRGFLVRPSDSRFEEGIEVVNEYQEYAVAALFPVCAAVGIGHCAKCGAVVFVPADRAFGVIGYTCEHEENEDET